MSRVFEVEKISCGEHFGSEFAERYVFAVQLSKAFRQLNPRVDDTFVAVLHDHAAPGAFAKNGVIFLRHEQPVLGSLGT